MTLVLNVTLCGFLSCSLNSVKSDALVKLNIEFSESPYEDAAAPFLDFPCFDIDSVLFFIFDIIFSTIVSILIIYCASSNLSRCTHNQKEIRTSYLKVR